MSFTLSLIFLFAIILGVFFSLLRMLLGPTSSDRAVAVDTITTTVVALLVLLALFFKRYTYLDISLVYSLLAFIGLVAIARFMERGI